MIAHKDGFNPYKVNIGYPLSSVGVVDAIGCRLLLLLLPGAGLFAPGAWELQENSFYYVLTPVNTSTSAVAK